MGKARKPSEWQIAAAVREARLAEIKLGLPKKGKRLLTFLEKTLRRYDAAVRAKAWAEADDATIAMDAGVEQWNGPDGHFGRVHAEHALRPKLAAPDGVEPMFGQPGRWIVEAAGCRCDFSTEGILSHIGGNDVRVVDFERPFISETGYRSLACGPTLETAIVAEGCETPTDMARTLIEAAATRDPNGKRLDAPRLVRVSAVTLYGEPKRPWAPPADDPAWQPGGFIHEARKAKPAAAAPVIRQEANGQLAVF